MTRFINTSWRTIMKGRALWDGAVVWCRAVHWLRSLAVGVRALSLGRGSGGAGKLTAKSVQQPLRDCVMHARRREGEKQ